MFKKNKHHLQPVLICSVNELPDEQREYLTRTSRNQTGKTKRESCATTGRGPKAPYTSQRLENEVSIKLPQGLATFPHQYFSINWHRN
jgi:hypothetical protein